MPAYRMLFARGAALTLLAGLVLGGCSAAKRPPPITLATTTSTRDSGLLDELLPRFQRRTGIEVKVVAVGSGQALELGRRGDADVLLTHAPAAEQQFMAEGHGALCWPVMYNDFVLVGPPSDPASVAKETGIRAAFKKIASRQATFVSRGDDSGTHLKEQALWDQAGVETAGAGYLEAGGGMARTLRLANEKRAYTLSDRGTFLAHREELDLAVLSEGDRLLRNPYAVIVVSAEKHPTIHRDGALRLARFLTEPKTQQWIGEFGSERFGGPLFFPDAPNQREDPQIESETEPAASDAPRSSSRPC